jgi:hypothetical protein
MDIPAWSAYQRRGQYLAEALQNHIAEDHKDGWQVEDKDCERCHNIKDSATNFIDDMPSILYKFIAVFMWIRHPIIMYQTRGNIRNIFLEDE